MALDSVSPLAAIQALLLGLVDGANQPLLKSVVIGVPTAIGNNVAAYVALSPQAVAPVASGVIQRESSYFIGIYYQMAASISEPELALAAVVDAFIKAVYADLTLGGLAMKLVLDLSLSKDPKYALVVGQEYRTFPAQITLTQRDSYNVTP